MFCEVHLLGVSIYGLELYSCHKAIVNQELNMFSTAHGSHHDAQKLKYGRGYPFYECSNKYSSLFELR